MYQVSDWLGKLGHFVETPVNVPSGETPKEGDG